MIICSYEFIKLNIISILLHSRIKLALHNNSVIVFSSYFSYYLLFNSYLLSYIQLF